MGVPPPRTSFSEGSATPKVTASLYSDGRTSDCASEPSL